MSQLLETIQLNNGKLVNIHFHTLRFNVALKNHFGIFTDIELSEKIIIPTEFKIGIYKCRITYSPKIDKIEFLPHNYRDINSLKLVYDNTIDYHLKYSNREKLQKLFEQRGNCDDILIVKKGCMSDSYTANPVFFDGKKWWTPNTPLLPGTQRARLLEEGHIFECRITPDDLQKYTKVGLINAMQDLKNMPVIQPNNIY